MYFSVHEPGLFYNFEILSFRSDKRNSAVLPTFCETMTSRAFDVEYIDSSSILGVGLRGFL
jgi:hypothetical protein